MADRVPTIKVFNGKGECALINYADRKKWAAAGWLPEGEKPEAKPKAAKAKASKSAKSDEADTPDE